MESQRSEKSEKSEHKPYVPAEQDIVRAYLTAINPAVVIPPVTIPPITLSDAQIAAIAKGIIIPTPPHEFTITGKASA